MQGQRLPYSFYLLILLAFISLPSFGDEPSPLEHISGSYERVLVDVIRKTPVSYSAENLSLEQLLSRINNASSPESKLAIVTTVVQHLAAVEGYANERHFASVVSFLLAIGMESVAERLLFAAEHDASEYGLATVRLAFARYYADNALWDQAIQQLSAIAINNLLAPLEADHAYLIYGLALQGKKQHRESVDYYRRVSKDSPHYRLAQLNTALAYIRQDWWTDAEMAIDLALSSQTNQPDDISDRLHTVLGFSQIQYGFYRRARDSFRNVRVDGAHANRALLGLGLSALHQNDVVAALNAFDHLKAGDRNDLSVAEAYLLSAYSLSQIRKTASASASYAEAIAFYQQYISRIEQQTKSLDASAVFNHQSMMSVSAMSAPADANLIFVWLQRLELLDVLSAQSDSPKIEALRREVSHALNQHAKEALSRRQKILESYLNQAHFGLATLYDSK